MDLRVLLKLDGSGFTQGVSKIRQQTAFLGEHTFGELKNTIAAAFTVGAVTEFSKKTMEFAGNMRDLADRLGVNVEWLQKMNNAAGQAGATAEDLANFMGKVAQAREAAFVNPEGKEAKTFNRLGFQPSDIANLSAQAFTEKMVQSFAGGLTGQMEVDLMDVGGKTAKKLLATFSQGIAEGGPIISEELIDTLDNLGDSLFILKQELMTGFAPVMSKSINVLRDFVREFGNAFGVVGAATSQFGMKDIQTPFDLFRTILSPKETAKKIADGVNAAQREIGDRDAKDAEAEDKMLAQRKQERENRRKRETSPPRFTVDQEVEKIPPAKRAAIVSDSLLAVGNFLGSSRSTIDNIARETNQILKQHTRLLEKIANASGSSLDINVPGYY